MPDSAVVSRLGRSDSSALRRRLPIGAEVMSDGRTHVRLWAPLAGRVDCVVTSRAEAQSTALMREAGEYFSGIVDARAGDRYQFRLNGEEPVYPDPASRFQPEGPHGASEIVDARTFRARRAK